MSAYDVAIIGGGIIGTSAAAYLAEAGRSVVLVEREQIAARQQHYLDVRVELLDRLPADELVGQ